ATSVSSALREATELGRLAKMPKLHVVQTRGAFPLARAYDRLSARILTQLGLEVPADLGERAARLGAAASPSLIASELAYAKSHRQEFMWPWEEVPHSIAPGILDDETYDWLAITAELLRTGAHPLLVDEAELARATALGRDETGIAVDPTGAAGLAGLLAL